MQSARRKPLPKTVAAALIRFMIDFFVLLAYAFSVLGLVLYSLHRGWLLLCLRRSKRCASALAQWQGPLPPVTVQLPVYNEKYVVERLIDAVCALEYPRELLQIQVLDDSSDETVERARRRTDLYKKRGFDIEHVRRPGREGYKAGALAHGLGRARGDFVLILDADFLPPPDLILRMLPPFLDPQVGMAQARWGHLNDDASWLTRAQALALDAHFQIEHAARAAAGLFFNFNGSAGVWRTRAIRDAGGWSSDTLTEDLDLSYRAQMRGWKFVYLPDVIVPAELPASVRALKSQQARWAQGSVQTARKLLPELLRGSSPGRVKLEALAHLTSYLPSPLTLALALLIFPAAVVRLQHGWPWLLLADLVIFAGAIGPLAYFYGEALRLSGRDRWPALAAQLPLILALGIGLSVNNTRALFAGLGSRRPAEFVRTPKRGASAGGYRSRLSSWGMALEAALAAYVALAVAYALTLGLYPSIPFLLLFQYGFTAVAAGSLREVGAR